MSSSGWIKLKKLIQTAVLNEHSPVEPKQIKGIRYFILEP